MGVNRSRAATLVGLSAAAGAFGAAAMMSAATAPTARADDFTDIINAVDGEFALGQTDFSNAFTDFSSSDVPAGLTSLFSGVDEDLWATSTTVEVGTVDALTGLGTTGEIAVGVPTPTDFSQAVTIAETQFSSGEAYFAAAATDLSSGMYADAVYDDATGSLLTFDFPAQVLLIGGVEALGL